jgi:hypothetical protein
MQKRWCIYWCLNVFRASTCPSSGEQYNADNACGVQHWPCCSRLEDKRWFGVHLLGLVSRLSEQLSVLLLVRRHLNIRSLYKNVHAIRCMLHDKELWRWINNQLDAEKIMYLLVSQRVSGINMPIIRRTVQSRQRLWCTALVVLQQTRRGEVCTCWDWFHDWASS